MKGFDKVEIIIPAFNEEKYVAEVIKDIKKLNNPNYQIVVVDDGSTDKTSHRASDAGASVIHLPKNSGKAYALRHASDMAIINEADYLVYCDSDGQHKAKDIPRLVNKLMIERLDIVFAYRDGKGMPLIKKLGNWGLSKITWVASGLNLRDSQCGLKAMTTEAYKKIRWSNDQLGYGVESEIIINCGERGLKYGEVMIDTVYHDTSKGTGIMDGVKISKQLMIRLKNKKKK